MRFLIFVLFIGLVLSLTTIPLFANNADAMQWDEPLRKLEKALTGPAVRIIGGLLVIGGGLAIAVTEGQGAKKFLRIIVYLGIALFVASIVVGGLW